MATFKKSEGKDMKLRVSRISHMREREHGRCCRCFFMFCRNYMNDALRTNAFVRFEPETIACACIYLAARVLQVRALDLLFSLFLLHVYVLGFLCVHLSISLFHYMFSYFRSFPFLPNHTGIFFSVRPRRASKKYVLAR